jgi:hypothetical protein
MRLQGKGRGLVVAVAMAEGQTIAPFPVEERGPRALYPLLQRLVVEVLVSDDLGSHRLLTRGLGLRHQVLGLHLLRWAGREL